MAAVQGYPAAAACLPHPVRAWTKHADKCVVSEQRTPDHLPSALCDAHPCQASSAMQQDCLAHLYTSVEMNCIAKQQIPNYHRY